MTKSAVTQQLIDMVEHSGELKKLLAKSIAKAKEINPDKHTNPAQSLSEFYAFVERSLSALPWEVLQDFPVHRLYDRIDQGLDYIYFLSDIPLEELEGKGYYNNSIQYVEPYRSWLLNSYTKAWGDFLNSEKSWNGDYCKMAYADERFGISKGWYENPSNWKTFNQFFARHLKSPDMRPIAEHANTSVVVSPADSHPQGEWKINANSQIVQHKGVRIKSKAFTSVVDLIGPNSAYNTAFADGTLTHTFLDVNDYHRYHFPVGGTIKEIRIISADDAAGGVQTWDAKRKRYVLHDHTPGWQSIETRSCIVLDTGDYGLVAVLPVGMSQVSSVNFEPWLKVGDKVKKGDSMGYFLFGGSDIVMIFQKGVVFSMTVPKYGNGGYKHVLMGEEYGRLLR
jgi:phosphatidylserine decarboxylase precursor